MDPQEQARLTDVASRIDPNDGVVALVRTKAATTTAGGLHLPTTEGKRPPNTGIVLAVGKDVPEQIRVGSKVSFSVEALHVTNIDGFDVIMMPQDMVYAAIR